MCLIQEGSVEMWDGILLQSMDCRDIFLVGCIAISFTIASMRTVNDVKQVAVVKEYDLLLYVYSNFEFTRRKLMS